MPPRRDLTGQTFGRLTVVSPNSSKKYYWDCLCSCGNKTVVAASSLVSGSTKACGCLQSRMKDLSGKVFGRLLVLSLSRTDKIAYWDCQCECGNKKVVAGVKLTRGDTRSCGCLHKEVTSLNSRKDLTGNVFGRLTVLGYHHTDKKVAYWSCLCSCGNEVVVRGSSLRNGMTKSCGCYRTDATKISNSTHGLTNHPLHTIWAGMKQRCYDTNCESYRHWGGRGISVCVEWLDFIPFYEWSVANGYERGLSIDRINNDGNYEPSNCRFTTRKVQGNNTRRNINVIYRGEIRSFNSLLDGDSRYLKVWKRIFARGWDTDRAIDTP